MRIVTDNYQTGNGLFCVLEKWTIKLKGSSEYGANSKAYHPAAGK